MRYFVLKYGAKPDKRIGRVSQKVPSRATPGLVYVPALALWLYEVIMYRSACLSLILLAYGAGAPARAQAPAAVPAAPPVVRYDIDVRLDAAAKALEGRQRLTWGNDSGDTVGDLWFHLYMNAFKNENTTFMRESGGTLRDQKARAGAWGWIDVRQIRTVDGDDLTGALEFVRPDDGNPYDQTVARVVLPRPVPPGGSVGLDVEFYTKLPYLFARAGYHSDFIFAGQWFPKLGVYEPAGRRGATAGGWNCHQYHATSEFYADFGDYAVNLTVPARFVVGATGVLRSARENAGEGTVTYAYAQDRVHDFAWTAYPHFRKIERPFRADQEVSPGELKAAAEWLGLPESEVRLRDVRMTLLMAPGHARQVERHFTTLRHAIKYFGLWYGPYPYDTITLVDPPWGAEGAGGMEYPTLFTGGTRWLLDAGTHEPEELIVHEFGHQYWYGIVATNEFEEPWMDEGMTTYSTGKVLDEVYGEGAVPGWLMHLPLGWFLRLRMGSDGFNRMTYLMAPRADRVVRRAWEYYDVHSYGINSYSRPALVLRTLENHLGGRTMARVMREYFRRWRFRHPTTSDFIQVAEAVSGRDLGWFFRQLLFGSAVLDYRVADVSSDPVGVGKGVYDTPGGRVTIDDGRGGGGREGGGSPGQEMYESVVTVRRQGGVIFPVDVRVLFEDGHIVTEHWDGEYRWTRFRYTRPAKVRYASVDPDRKLLLDVNFSNNGRRREPDPRPSAQWSARVLFWLQNLLQWLAAFS